MTNKKRVMVSGLGLMVVFNLTNNRQLSIGRAGMCLTNWRYTYSGRHKVIKSSQSIVFEWFQDGFLALE